MYQCLIQWYGDNVELVRVDESMSIVTADPVFQELGDFEGNTSKTWGAINVGLTIGSKTLLTMFFIIDGKGSYSLLLGHDWIHANCCVPSTMHQCVIQWHGDDVEVVRVDESMSIATADPVFQELGDFECFSGKLWE